MPEELWMEAHNIVQEEVIKMILKKKKCKKRQNSCLRSPCKWLRKEKKLKAKERRKAIPFEYKCRVSTNRRRDKKAFLSDQYKEIEENKRMGKTRDLFKKIRDTKGILHAKMGTIKDRNSMDLTGAEDIEKWQDYTEELYKKDLLHLLGPYCFYPLLCPSLHEVFPWYL